MKMEVLTSTQLDEIDIMRRVWGVPDNWQVLLVGDGAGSGWETACAWAVTLIDRDSKRRQWFYGGMNRGTSNVAELVPYVHAMNWYAERCRRVLANGGELPPVQSVHIVSDHEAVKTVGEALAKREKSLADVHSNRAYWAALLTFAQEGFLLHYHYAGRLSSALNSWADRMAGNVFATIKTVPLPKDDKGQEVTPYECNADHGQPTMVHAMVAKPAKPKRKKKARPIEDEEAA